MNAWSLANAMSEKPKMMPVWSLAEARAKKPIMMPPSPAPIKGRGGRKPKYPWRMLGINGNFLVPWYRNEPVQKLWNSLTSCKANAQRKTGFKFELHRVPGGIRVWRVS